MKLGTRVRYLKVSSVNISIINCCKKENISRPVKLVVFIFVNEYT